MTDREASRTWSSSGNSYGLEPLRLPATGAAYAPSGPPDPCERERSARTLDTLAAGTACSDEGPIWGTVPPETLAWFRWINGHQVCFLLWRLLADLDDLADGPIPADRAPAAQAWIDAYSAMLIYTGSCSPEVYAATVRPTMQRQHPAFSGGWAPDFAPVRHLLRGRLGRFATLPGVAGAVADNQRVHSAVADWLVHGGPSLLRQSNVGRVDLDLSRMLYDAYFVTVRLPTTGWEASDQLLRRSAAVVTDLDTNGLYPADDARLTRPELGSSAPAVAAALVVATRFAFEHMARLERAATMAIA